MTIRRIAHLTDHRLTDVCLDGDPTPAERDHLDRCEGCRERRAQLDAMLQEISRAAEAETDVAFPPQRLLSQHARILQRIAQDGRPARVIAFPASTAPEARPFRGRPAARWIAAAAVAGLVIGMVVGRWTHLAPSSTALRASSTRGVSVRLEPVAAFVPQVLALSEDELLGEIENAVAGPVPVLRPIHEMTPLVDQVVGTSGVTGGVTSGDIR